jgi:hypothetical protein
VPERSALEFDHRRAGLLDDKSRRRFPAFESGRRRQLRSRSTSSQCRQRISLFGQPVSETVLLGAAALQLLAEAAQQGSWAGPGGRASFIDGHRPGRVGASPVADFKVTQYGRSPLPAIGHGFLYTNQMAISLAAQLLLDRCPHCGTAKPLLKQVIANLITTTDYAGAVPRGWKVYACTTCGGAILAGGQGPNPNVAAEIYPAPRQVDSSVPERPRTYLTQALASVHAPSGAIMLAAASVDAMLREKAYKAGSLYTRIDQAAKDHLITTEMAEWAHEVRLDANDERHPEESRSLPGEQDALRAIEFARALAEFLFVLPARVASTTVS